MKTFEKQKHATQVFALLLLAFPFAIAAQQQLEIDVSAGSHSHHNLPVQLPIGPYMDMPWRQMRLVEVTADARRELPFQVLHTSSQPVAHWLLDGTFPAGSQRRFVFEQAMPSTANPSQTAELSAVDLQLKTDDGRVVLGYRHALQPVPEGVSPRYSRAGFIHPINTPSGETLTRIQPPDHYHHYGLWNPWTRIEYRNKTYDLWNLNDNLGTVRFAGFDTVYAGAVASGFDAVHHHVIFDGDQEETIIHEHWKITAFPAQNSRYIIDITSALTPTGAEKENVILKEYRYGGMGMRAREEWTNQNSDILTSSGKGWGDADGSLEKWAIVSGELGQGTGGILFMSYPENYNFPEPIRVWPKDGNGGRGDQFFNFSPTKNKDWVLADGQEYTLRYRLLVFDGTLSAAEAEQYWQSFANPPAITVKKR